MCIRDRMKKIRDKPDKPILFGWLEKKKSSSSIVSTAYNNRFFVLSEDALVYFQELDGNEVPSTNQGSVAPKQRLELQDILDVSSAKQGTGDGYTFVVAAESRMMKLRTDSMMHATEWVENIRVATKAKQEATRLHDLHHMRTADLLDKSELISPRILRQLWMKLPPELRLKQWALAFSPDLHGSHLGTLFHNCKGQGPTLMIIEDTKGAMFGVYGSEPFSPEHKRYFGQGSCFVFRIDPKDEDVTTYQWSRRNRYFLSSSLSHIGVGGGEGGGFAIHLDTQLAKGSSSQCVTFFGKGEEYSPILSSGEQFVVKSMEIWCFVSSENEHQNVKQQAELHRTQSVLLPDHTHTSMTEVVSRHSSQDTVSPLASHHCSKALLHERSKSEAVHHSVPSRTHNLSPRTRTPRNPLQPKSKGSATRSLDPSLSLAHSSSENNIAHWGSPGEKS
eukprot:TRINITY_DN20347_c0_g1_i1.p1 TRINITY_DN20347_c0_g1~~TRINITY_DN20347_c0_g1_i1.p1  ORF type:complete len:447 (-),score=93.59 TRINITY_DN20347_c0_g1_i1:216-1556(-)